MKKLISAFLILALTLSCAVSAFAASKLSAPKLSAAKNTRAGIVLKWKSVKGATKYCVYRKVGKTAYKRLATVKSATYTHKSAVSGTRYSYRIKAFGKGAASGYSSARTITRVATPSLKLSNTNSSVKARWSTVKKASGYVLLFKKSSAKKYSVLYRGKAKTFSFDIIASGGSYDMKVKAVIGKDSGAYSSVKSDTFLEAPSIVAEELLDMKGITLKWGKIYKAQKYLIYRSLKSENSFKRIAAVTSTTYIDSDITGINSYKYYVKAYANGSASAKSNIDGDVFGVYTSDDDPLYLTISNGEVYTDISDKLISKVGKIGIETYFHWRSADTSVLTVDAYGVITAKKRGKTTIYVKIDPIDGYTKSTHTIMIEVTVK